jgi:hypothetical protein
MITQICVVVYDKENATGAVTKFEPFFTSSFTIDQTSPASYNPQIKSIITYDNGSWIEAWGAEHGVTYEYDKSKLRINEVGVVYPLQGGTHEITVKCASLSYVAKVTVIASEKVFVYDNVDFSDPAAAKLINTLNSTTYEITEDGMLCTAVVGEDPNMMLSFIAGGLNTEDYKSITLTYKLAPGTSKTVGQVFFLTGANPKPAESASQKYTMTADGEWHTVTIDLAGKAFWSGTFNQLRFDFLDHCEAGDSVLLKSIVLNPVD